MKKIFSLIGAGGVITSLMIASCTHPVDTVKEWASIDSIANSKLIVLRDSLNMTCMNGIMMTAQMKADSMFKAAMKSSGGKPKPKAQEPMVLPPPVKKDIDTNPKGDKMTGTNESNTEAKGDKISGKTDSTNIQKKKDKMNPPKK